MRTTRVITLAAATLLGAAALVPTVASARMGGHMGGHFAGGMGGRIGAGHFAARAFAPHAFVSHAGPVAFHRNFAFHNRFAFRHHFRRGFAFAAVPYVVDSGCWQWWHGRRVWVCSDY
jgi:hypothetical protein